MDGDRDAVDHAASCDSYLYNPLIKLPYLKAHSTLLTVFPSTEFV